MWAAAAVAFLAALGFAPSEDQCAAADDQVVSSHAFVTLGWTCGLALLSATITTLIRRQGVWAKLGFTILYLAITLVVVVIIALQDNPCGL